MQSVAEVLAPMNVPVEQAGHEGIPCSDGVDNVGREARHSDFLAALSQRHCAAGPKRDDGHVDLIGLDPAGDHLEWVGRPLRLRRGRLGPELDVFVAGLEDLSLRLCDGSVMQGSGARAEEKTSLPRAASTPRVRIRLSMWA